MIEIKTIKPFRNLIKYESWKSGWMEEDGVDIFSYISDMCNPEYFLLSCKLLFPDFVVIKGAVFLENRFSSDIFYCWLKQLNGDVHAVEKIMNHMHLYDVFGGSLDDVDDAVLAQLSEVIALSWRLVLKDKFPEREFSVEVSNTDQDYGPIVTFYQVVAK